MLTTDTVKREPSLGLLVIGKSQQEISYFLQQGAFLPDEPKQPIGSVDIFEEVDILVSIANPGGKHGGLGYLNNMVRAWLSETSNDVLGMVHADTRFQPGALSAFAQTVFQTNIVAGIVGRQENGNYLWSSDFSVEDRAVTCLDACGTFFDTALFEEKVFFDTKTFDHFHACVEDFCLQVRYNGGMIQVPKVLATHRGGHPGLNESPALDEWTAAYHRDRFKLDTKWAGKGLIYHLC